MTAQRQPLSARSRHCLIAAGGMLIALAPLAASAQSGSPSVRDGERVGRYTVMDARPTAAQLNPLDAVVVVNMPPETVRTVGDAVSHLLARTGYRLMPASQQGPEVATVLSLPLPLAHRRLGPYTVRSGLTVLAGPAFTVKIDPVQRVVSYSLPMSAATTAASDAAPAATVDAPSAPRVATPPAASPVAPSVERFSPAGMYVMTN